MLRSNSKDRKYSITRETNIYFIALVFHHLDTLTANKDDEQALHRILMK
jgi:hypothetical protein